MVEGVVVGSAVASAVAYLRKRASEKRWSDQAQAVMEQPSFAAALQLDEHLRESRQHTWTCISLLVIMVLTVTFF